jgi:hypothetical protein
MAWIALFALMIALMLTLSAMGAERNFRRTLDTDPNAVDRFLTIEILLKTK